MKIRPIYKALERDETKIGNIRKYVSDVALLRNHQRGPTAKDLILVSNDADCKGMSRNYINNFINKFAANEKIDAVLGKIDWEPEAYIKSPLLHVGTRFFQYLDIIFRHHKQAMKKGVGSSGANFALKGSMYAAVGGYLEEDTIAEDKNLGSMVKYARSGAAVYPIEYGEDDSLVYTNARRGIYAIKSGLAPAEQWGTDFGPDDILRETDWKMEETGDIEKLLDDNSYQERLRIGIQKFINRTLRIYSLSPNSWEAKRAIAFLGVKYEIKDSQVSVTDISKMVSGLKEYQKKGLKTYRKKISQIN